MEHCILFCGFWYGTPASRGKPRGRIHGQSGRLYAGKRPIPQARLGQWTVVGIASVGGDRGGGLPLPAQAGPGHNGKEQESLPVVNPGMSSWKIKVKR